jgi:hypothetical protein
MIIFYAMDMCGFCTKAKSELGDEIASGFVVVKGTSDAPAGVKGFPHFVNSENGKKHSGYAPKAELFKSLGVDNESYESCPCRVRHSGGYLKLSQTWA